MLLRRLVAWWLERAAERRTDEGHRIYRAHVDGQPCALGEITEPMWTARNRFNFELNAAKTMRETARFLRGRTKEAADRA